jgi:predicted transcriptional regulator
MNTTIKINEETRKKLKLLAALLDKTMIEVLDQLITEALAKVQSK